MIYREKVFKQRHSQEIYNNRPISKKSINYNLELNFYKKLC